jgi:hypothetical protein
MMVMGCRMSRSLVPGAYILARGTTKNVNNFIWMHPEKVNDLCDKRVLLEFGRSWTAMS